MANRNDDLDDEERQIIEKHRAERAKQRSEDFEIEVGDGEGNYARIPYSKGRNWLRSKGIEIDDEPEQDDDDEPGDPKRKTGSQKAKQGDNVRAFRSGRRIS